MKKQNKFMEFLNSKGFYTALFTCLFAVLAIAAFVSIRNIDAITKLTTYGEKDISYEDELRPPEVRQEARVPESVPESVEAPTVQTPDKSTAAPAKTVPKTQSAPLTPKPNESSTSGTTSRVIPVPEAAAPPESEQAKREQPAPKEDVKTEEKEQAAEPAKKPEQKAEPAPQASADFNGEDMAQPLDSGEIVMDFSPEHAIYDKTLEQYRTNPTVSIASEVGTQVKATADGIVKSITIDPRTGYTLVIDHGNGWQSVYGQLQETVLVKEGDGVKKGQAVGGVGAPTKYGILLGPHLVFGINKDDVPQNPNIVLAESE